MSEGAQVFVGPSKLQETGGEARKEELREAAKRARSTGYTGSFRSPEEAREAANITFALGRRGLREAGLLNGRF
jgi:hypothetical protein